MTGEKVDILGREGDWYKIKFKDGVGYVSAQFISSTVVIHQPWPRRATTARLPRPRRCSKRPDDCQRNGESEKGAALLRFLKGSK